MAEITRNSINKGIAFDIPGVTPSSAKVRRGSVEVDAPISAGAALIPYSITRYDGKFTIEWTYMVEGQTYTKKDTHEVYTPFFTKEELISWDSDFGLLDDAAVHRLEVIIRSLIENATGQNFSLETGTVTIQGSGGQFVRLPKRLVSATRLNDASGELLNSWVNVTNDGWALRVNRRVSWVDNLASSNPPIENPYKAYGLFKEDRFYTIEGLFGYTNVPADILLAARILAEDYGCDESLWRDRYVDNIRAADWRLEFNSKAFTGTGNVKADQLLEKYTLDRMVVL